MPKKSKIWTIMSPYAEKRVLKKKHTLLTEGEMADTLYFIESGCLRSWFNHDGNDISFQFFLAGSMVASSESLMMNKPSLYTIEAILPTTVYAVPKQVLLQLVEDNAELKDMIFDQISQRLFHYQQLFLSRIKDTPQARYEELIREQPDLIRLIPQHYIASYLGITSVSLSRIRCRK